MSNFSLEINPFFRLFAERHSFFIFESNFFLFRYSPTSLQRAVLCVALFGCLPVWTSGILLSGLPHLSAHPIYTPIKYYTHRRERKKGCESDGGEEEKKQHTSRVEIYTQVFFLWFVVNGSRFLVWGVWRLVAAARYE